jgi:uncharacterized protein
MPASLAPRVHRFELHGAKLAFDAGSGTLLELDEAAWRVLGACLEGGSAPETLLSGARVPSGSNNGGRSAAEQEAQREVGRLRESGLLFSRVPLAPRLEPVLKALCLHVAHRCQMACAYCFASGGDYGGTAGSGLMPPATARAAIDFLLNSSPGVKRWAIDFFGGEPLLNWPAVKETILYAERRAASAGGRVHFTLTTNGLGLTPSRLAFLDRHGVGLIISLDGRPAVHDALRRTISGRPTWSRAAKAARLAASARIGDRGDAANGPAFWVRGTFTRRNLDFAQDALFLYRLGFPQVSLEPVCGGPPELALRPEDVPVLAGQYELLAGECAANGFRFYHFELDLGGGPCISRRIAACGAGSEYLTVTPEGDLYACHQLVGRDDFRVGDVWHGITRPEVGRRFLGGDVTSGQCSGCWARFLCGGGCRATAFFEHGDLARPPSLECALQQKRWECALWLAAQRRPWRRAQTHAKQYARGSMKEGLIGMRADFSGFFAEFYDILHAGLHDIEPYIGYAREFGPKILELGSGTGRILVPLARAGFEVTGVDIAEDMLAVCRRKLEQEPPEVRGRVRIVKGNIIGLSLPDTFDLVIAPCNLLNCLTGPGDGSLLLQSAKRHLKEEGVFILDNSIPHVPHLVESSGVTETLEFTHPVTGSKIVDTFTPNYDFTLQRETDHIILEERSGDRLLRRAEATCILTFYFPREVRMMLTAAGFEIFREQGSIGEDVPIDAEAGEMVFFCRKA